MVHNSKGGSQNLCNGSAYFVLPNFVGCHSHMFYKITLLSVILQRSNLTPNCTQKMCVSWCLRRWKSLLASWPQKTFKICVRIFSNQEKRNSQKKTVMSTKLSDSFFVERCFFDWNCYNGRKPIRRLIVVLSNIRLENTPDCAQLLLWITINLYHTFIFYSELIFELFFVFSCDTNYFSYFQLVW